MVIAVFRARLRPGVSEEYGRLAQRMFELASAMPGFKSFRSYTAEDGEGLALVEFESEAAMTAWREHPEHREAQRRGREEFYAEYEIQICQPLRSHSFRR